MRITSSKHELFYHCVTRVVAGEHLFGDREKAVFRSIMQKVAEFCGVDILTYCVMSNHIHILCRVPPADYTKISDKELLRRYRVLFSTPSDYRPYHPDTLESLLQSNSSDAQKARHLLLRRMHNVSTFMKILKLRMSIWFNKTHKRFGTLWAEKFKSIVVEGHGNPLLRMAQYIDLNPIRAGMTDTFADYPYSGFASARNGSLPARRGIEWIVQFAFPTLPKEEAIRWYEEHLLTTLGVRSMESRHQRSDSSAKTSTLSPLLHRQHRFSKSLAMGSREFLQLLMNLFGPAFSPEALREGPHRDGSIADDGVYFGRKERPQKPEDG